MTATARIHLPIVLALALSLYAPAHGGESDLAWSTFLGGSGAEFDIDYTLSHRSYGLCVDEHQHVYVTGLTWSADFPIIPGSFDTSANGRCDVFVAKFDSTGRNLIYSTFLGGSEDDWGADIAVDPYGAVCITGGTRSSNFPTTIGTFDWTFNGAQDVFVTKLNAGGDEIVFSTFIGGDSTDWGNSLVAQGDSIIFLAGATMSNDFPVTSGAFDMTFNGRQDAFVIRMYANGQDLYYSTFLGGGSWEYATDISIGGSDNAYVTGHTGSGDFPVTPGAYDTYFNSGHMMMCDIFVTKLDITGGYLEYSTFLGGWFDDLGWGITVDESGCAYVTGGTVSPGYPTTPGAFSSECDGDPMTFITKLNPTGSSLVYSTCLGDEGCWGSGIALDDKKNVLITGTKDWYSFLTTSSADETSRYSGNEVLVAKMNSIGSALAFFTYLGGSGHDRGLDIALDSNGNAYVIGWTSSVDYPTTPGAFDTSYNEGGYDVFVSRLNLGNYFAPPEPIQDLAAVTAGSLNDTLGNLHLSWSPPVSDAGLSYYVVYRSTDPASAGDSLAMTNETEYLDQNVTGEIGTNYFYTVRAVDVYGNKSDHGNMTGEFDRTVSPGK